MADSSKRKVSSTKPVVARPRRTSEVRAGRPGSKPLALIYRDGGRVCAAILQPGRPTALVRNSTGPYAALGIFKDEGYDFKSIRIETPQWAQDRVPEGCTLIGCAAVVSTPLS